MSIQIISAAIEPTAITTGSRYLLSVGLENVLDPCIPLRESGSAQLTDASGAGLTVLNNIASVSQYTSLHDGQTIDTALTGWLNLYPQRVKMVKESDEKYHLHGQSWQQTAKAADSLNLFEVADSKRINVSWEVSASAAENKITLTEKEIAAQKTYCYAAYDLGDPQTLLGKSFTCRADVTSTNGFEGNVKTYFVNDTGETIRSINFYSLNSTIKIPGTMPEGATKIALLFYSRIDVVPVGTVTYSNIMVNEGTEARPYEPYRKACPAPDKPSKFKSMDDFDIEIKSTNLFDIDATWVQSEGGYLIDSEYQSAQKIRPFLVREGESYVVVTKGTIATGDYSAIYFGGDDLWYSSSGNESMVLRPFTPGMKAFDQGKEIKRTVTATKTCMITRIMIHGSGEKSSAYKVDHIGVFQSDRTDTVSYAPYIQPRIVRYPGTLSAVDRSTDEMIADLTSNTVSKITTIANLALGDRSWTPDVGTENTIRYYTEIGEVPDQKVLCSHFPGREITAAHGDFEYALMRFGRLYFNVFRKTAPDPTSFGAWINGQETKGTPVVVQYETGTPVEENITSTPEGQAILSAIQEVEQ